MFAVLKKFGFGDTFISWIRLLYSSPKVSVHTNDVYSDYFTLERGSRQGCPLSPLLFAIAIEPLSITLRSSPLFRGITRNGIEYKLSLYADDLLLYITDPTLSIPAVLSILENFSVEENYVSQSVILIKCIINYQHYVQTVCVSMNCVIGK